jgi:hypothetical protein
MSTSNTWHASLVVLAPPLPAHAGAGTSEDAKKIEGTGV